MISFSLVYEVTTLSTIHLDNMPLTSKYEKDEVKLKEIHNTFSPKSPKHIFLKNNMHESVILLFIFMRLNQNILCN